MKVLPTPLILLFLMGGSAAMPYWALVIQLTWLTGTELLKPHADHGRFKVDGQTG